MKYLYCYLGKSEHNLFKYCDLSDMIRSKPVIRLQEFNLDKPISDGLYIGELFLLGSDNLSTYPVDIDRYSGLIKFLEIYKTGDCKSDQVKLALECLSGMKSYINLKLRDQRIKSILVN